MQFESNEENLNLFNGLTKNKQNCLFCKKNLDYIISICVI